MCTLDFSQHTKIIPAQSAVQSQSETHTFFHTKQLMIYLDQWQLRSTSAFPFIPCGTPGAAQDIYADYLLYVLRSSHM